MRQILFWAALAVAGFLGWQYWNSRRKNAGLEQYYEETNRSRRANAEAANVWQRVFPASAAIDWDVRGWVLQLDPATPRVLADGSWGTARRWEDVRQPVNPWLFGFGGN
jgi:hypothetical protein